MSAYDNMEGIHCSFCGKGRKDVQHIIAGPCVYICEECCDLCAEILEQYRMCWCPNCGASRVTPNPIGDCEECGFPMRRQDPGGCYIMGPDGGPSKP